MKKNIDRGGNYYPTDSAGVIDEWAAIARQQDQIYQQKLEEDKANKKIRVDFIHRIFGLLMFYHHRPNNMLMS